MRILKGQDILPDDNTLVQHNISDGDTVNIVIEPEKQITVNVICKLETFRHEISSSILMRDLKQKLIDSDQVGFLPDEFDFKAKLPEEDARILEDDELPLQHYGIQDDCKLSVVKPYLFLTLMSEDQSRKVYRKIPMTITVQELKMMIKELFCDKNVADISWFVTNDQITYVKPCSSDNIVVGEILSDDQLVCYIVNRCDYDKCYPVKHRDVEIGRVYGVSGDIVSTIKLKSPKPDGYSCKLSHCDQE